MCFGTLISLTPFVLQIGVWKIMSTRGGMSKSVLPFVLHIGPGTRQLAVCDRSGRLGSLVFCVSHHKEAVTVVLNPAVCVCVLNCTYVTRPSCLLALQAYPSAMPARIVPARTGVRFEGTRVGPDP